MPEITDLSFRREERVDADTLRVTRKSTFTGAVHTLALPITEGEWQRYQAGHDLIQDALPRLTNPEREFLLTGATHDEWQAELAPEDEFAGPSPEWEE